MRVETPDSIEEAARVMRAAHEQELRVRCAGAGTKSAWGTPAAPVDLELSSKALGRVIEHNAGDLTAVLQAGVPLQRAEGAFSEAKQMLALDPPLGPQEAATIGGVVATSDQGPMRHRYGACRDLLLGVTAVLADGTVARAGGKVIKNVAGYDLAKLLAGSFGTLGMLVEVVVRLHPAPENPLTVIGASDDPSALQRAALDLAHALFEVEALDVWWEDGAGGLLALFGGGAPERQSERAEAVFAGAGLEASTSEGIEAWGRQRRGQRQTSGAVVRFSHRPVELAEVIDTARSGGARLVGRAGLGVSWLAWGDAAASELIARIEDARKRLRPRPSVVLDAPDEVRRRVDVWGEQDGGTVELMRRVKARFDPRRTMNPGVFVGGI